MAKTKLERISSIDEDIAALKNRQKILRQQHNKQERKERNHRLYRRAGHMESIVPDTILLTDEQFYTFLNKTLLTSFASRILAELVAQSPIPDADPQADIGAEVDGDTPDDEPAATAAQSGGAASAKTGETAKVTG